MNKKHGKPSACTILYWLIQDKKIEPGVFFNFQEIFWPTFIKKNGFIFLKEAFSEEEYERLVKENTSPEYWINLLTIDEFFSEMPDWEEKSSVFAKTLVSLWTAKLKKEFSDIDFTVEYLCNEECGDYGLTFYQTDKNNFKKLNAIFGEIGIPHIKESRIEQSSTGSRPGIPKIRKPRADEIPEKH